MDSLPIITLTIVAPVPSPYQVELFNALAAEPGVQLQVVYLQHRHADRLWAIPNVEHVHAYWEDGSAARAQSAQAVDDADLVVFSYYANPAAQMLIRRRARIRRPWVYWGERPGFGGWGWMGRWRRRLMLAPLHRRSLPIWGMGKWAVEAWRSEFGEQRSYQNIPYFSDLQRFGSPRARESRPDTRRFLFSGAFTRRKGVDLLAEAFLSLAPSRPHVGLDFVGAGELESHLRRKLARHAHQVRFHGFQQWKDLPARYNDADILVAPSRYDGWGLVVPEGLAAGLPVIGTDRTGAVLDLLSPGKSGWIVRAGDAGVLAGAMAEAADLPCERLKEMSSAARASVAEHSLAHGVRRFISAARAAMAAASAA